MTDLTKIKQDAVEAKDKAGEIFSFPPRERILILNLATNVLTLADEVERLRKALEKCREQRDNASMCYYEQIYAQTKLGLEKFGRDKHDEDQELEQILKGG